LIGAGHVWVVLGPPVYYIADTTAKEDTRAHSDGMVEGIVKERTQLAGTAVGGISQFRVEYTHIGVDHAVR
jgi:hypothetical protein